MAGFLSVENGNMVIESNGVTRFSTTSPLMNLVPDAAIQLSNYSIAFPDLWKGVIYHQTRRTTFSGDLFGCSTWVGLVEQEWGPDKASPNTLSDIVLGTAPAGTDYLDVMVNLTRTVVPDKRFDMDIRAGIVEGQWIKLEGGSCMVEGQGPLRRLFEIILVGTDVVLRRRQSVTANGEVNRITGGASINPKVFYFPGTNAPQDSGKLASYGELIQQRGESGGDTHRPAGYESGSSNNTECSRSLSGKSYASTWTGSLIITPGRISA